MFPVDTTPTNRLPRIAEPQSPLSTLGRTAGNALVSAFALAIAIKVVDMAFAAITRPRPASQPQRQNEHVTA